MQKTPKGLRIALCSAGAGHVFRGIESWSVAMAELLRRRGLDFVFFKGGGRVEHPDEQVIHCLHRGSLINRLLVGFFSPLGGWRYGLGTGVQLEQRSFFSHLLPRVRQGNFTLVHTQEFHLAELLERQRNKGLLATRTILGHGTNETDADLMHLQYVQHLTPYELATRKKRGCWKKTWTAIPNFVATDTYKPADNEDRLRLRREFGLPEKGPVVLTVAAIKKDHKRIDLLVDEMWRLQRGLPGCRWIVAGGREADSDAIIDCATEKLGGGVRFYVDLAPDKVCALYKCADVFLLGSLREMCPIALMEAVSSGVPCLVHDHPVLRYIAGAGGVYTDMSRSGAIAEELSELLPDRNRLHALGREGRQHALSLFSPEGVMDRTLDYYRFVLEQ